MSSKKSSASKNARARAGARKRGLRERATDQMRQLLHPSELRIPDPGERVPIDEDGSPSVVHELSPEASKALRDLATGVWRILRRLSADETVDDATKVRGAMRHAEACLDAASSVGLVIRDHIGERYKTGLPWFRVLSWEKSPGCVVETVLRAQRPEVRLGDRLIQEAEIIVGIPDYGAAEFAGTPPPQAPPEASSETTPATPSDSPPASDAAERA